MIKFNKWGGVVVRCDYSAFVIEGCTILCAEGRRYKMKPFGHFVFDTLLRVVEASMYEARSGMMETDLHSWKFDSGEALTAKMKFLVMIDELEVVEEDEAGRATMEAEGGGNVQVVDEDQKVLFEGKWRADVSSTRLVVDNNMVIEFTARGTYGVVGVDRYEGHVVSGKFVVEEVGLDETGMGIYRIRGEGIIQQKSANQSLPIQGR